MKYYTIEKKLDENRIQYLAVLRREKAFQALEKQNKLYKKRETDLTI